MEARFGPPPFDERTIYAPYARELLPFGHGYALWQADPGKDGRQVTLGDVGYLDEGRFCFWFNTRISGHDYYGVPLLSTHEGSIRKPGGFKPLPESQLSVVKRIEGEDQAPMMCSKKLLDTLDIEDASELIQKMDGRYEFRFIYPPSVGAILLFRKPLEVEQLCEKLDADSGTSQQPTTQTDQSKKQQPTTQTDQNKKQQPTTQTDKGKKPEMTQTDKTIASYLSQSRKSWDQLRRFQPSVGRILAEEDYVFIAGTTKTWRWAGMAYERLPDWSRLRLLVLEGFPSLRRLYFDAPDQYNVGLCRTYGSSAEVELPDGTMGDGPRNQCNFIHYYKFKRSYKWRPPRVIKAAAGPHQLPRGPDDEGSAPALAAFPNESSACGDWTQADDSGSREKRSVEKAYDPVAPVLDYIIEHSAAKTAVASTMDLNALFEVYGYSSDIRALLERVKPVIDLDEDGVGIIGALDPLVHTVQSGDDVKNVHACAQDVPSFPIHCPRVGTVF